MDLRGGGEQSKDEGGDAGELGGDSGALGAFLEMKDRQQGGDGQERGSRQPRIAEQAADASSERDEQKIAQAGMIAGRGFALRSDEGTGEQGRGELRGGV